MDQRALDAARHCKGFLDEEEGARLYDLARTRAHLGPVLEIGSYCGKSSCWLGAGACAGGGVLLCLDHHRGSEEHQLGEGYHDPDLFDDAAGRVDSLPFLRRTLHDAGLEESAVLLVAPSARVAAFWTTPLGLVFIDGGHSLAAAQTDYQGFARHVAPGGILAIHDLFPNPEEGGQAPITIYREALASGLFDELSTVKTLGVLRRRR